MGRGESPGYLFEGDLTELPFKMAENFLSNSENKDKLNEYLAKKLLELHQSDQMLVATYKNTFLVSQTSRILWGEFQDWYLILCNEKDLQKNVKQKMKMTKINKPGIGIFVAQLSGTQSS